MTQTIGWGLASALLAMIVSVVSPAVGVHANGENVELNDLSELAEGETRTFGSGEDVITATREGDVIRIEISSLSASSCAFSVSGGSPISSMRSVVYCAMFFLTNPP